MSDIMTPAKMAAAMPSDSEPVRLATAKPATAPITIMPSTPRLSTPERSATSWPCAASSKGVAAVMMVRISFSMAMGSSHTADAIKD